MRFLFKGLMLEGFTQNFLEDEWETPMYSQSVRSVCWAGLEAAISRIEDRIPHLCTVAILRSSELKIVNKLLE